MTGELVTPLENLSPIQRVEYYQKEIALLYYKSELNPMPNTHVSKLPFVTIANSDVVHDSREKLGVGYVGDERGISPVWMDETNSFEDPRLSLQVLARFAVIVDPKARSLNSAFKINILIAADKLRANLKTMEEYRLTERNLLETYDASIIAYARSNKDFLIAELEKALKAKLEEMQAAPKS